MTTQIYACRWLLWQHKYTCRWLLLQHKYTCRWLLWQHKYTCRWLLWQHKYTCRWLLWQHKYTCRLDGCYQLWQHKYTCRWLRSWSTSARRPSCPHFSPDIIVLCLFFKVLISSSNSPCFEWVVIDSRRGFTVHKFPPINIVLWYLQMKVFPVFNKFLLSSLDFHDFVNP